MEIEQKIASSDNQHYEKIGKTVKCIEDETPFEIPENWAWCRLGAIIELISGQDQPPSGYNDHQKGIHYITGASNIENEKIIINRWTESPKSIATNGDLLITCKGTVGTIALSNPIKKPVNQAFQPNLPVFSNKQDDKPGYVVNNHLSRTAVAGSLKRPT